MIDTNTGEQKQTLITAEQFRKRIEYEDALLYKRFQIVLLVNGFAAVAVGFNQPIQSKILIAFVMIVLNVLGTLAIWKTEWVISAITRRYRHDHPDNALENTIQKVLGKPGLLRPNQILCRIFPTVLTVGWMAGFGMAIAALVFK